MNDNTPTLAFVEIPMGSLSAEALGKVIEHFVAREGTDYGVIEISHETKVEQIRKQLLRGHVKIIFNPEDESITLMTAQDFKKLSAPLS